MPEKYKPVRVLQDITVAHENRDVLAEEYPHAELSMVRSKGAKTDTYSVSYRAGKVVDAPTDQERKLFDLLSKSVIMIIPQHKDGYDHPESGLARSRKGSHLGRQKWEFEMAKRKAAKTAKKSPPSTKLKNKEVTPDE